MPQDFEKMVKQYHECLGYVNQQSVLIPAFEAEAKEQIELLRKEILRESVKEFKTVAGEELQEYKKIVAFIRLKKESTRLLKKMGTDTLKQMGTTVIGILNKKYYSIVEKFLVKITLKHCLKKFPKWFKVVSIVLPRFLTRLISRAVVFASSPAGDLVFVLILAYDLISFIYVRLNMLEELSSSEEFRTWWEYSDEERNEFYQRYSAFGDVEAFRNFDRIVRSEVDFYSLEDIINSFENISVAERFENLKPKKQENPFFDNYIAPNLDKFNND